MGSQVMQCEGSKRNEEENFGTGEGLISRGFRKYVA